ncbi:hypothetical protein SAMN04244548_03007 [Paracoccus pantotrophus]|nr:hypothetical protein SAMN04244548_03007 [Paracoccus pantotrophus]
MTWFLDNAKSQAAGSPQPIAGQIPGWWEQAVGSARDVWWRRDSWGAEYQYRGDLVREMLDALGGYQAVYGDDFDMSQSVEQSKTMPYDLAKRIGELRASDKEGRFSSLPGSAEEFDAELLRRRKRDFDENRAMLDRGDSTTAVVAGEMAGTLLEPASIATLPLGGSMRNAGRFILAEGALGAAADLPGVVREQSVAKDLGFTPSNPAAELAFSAGASAGFAGVMVGAGRALSYGRARITGEAEIRPAGRPGEDYQNDLDTAETDLRMGREPSPAAPYRPDINLPADQDPAVMNLARLVAKLEAPKGFDQVYSGTVLRPPRPITTMTINEVLAWQGRSVAAGSKSSAAGGFQIIQDTLRATRDALGLTGDEIFDEAMQTRMAVHLMQGRGLDDWRAGRISTEQFMDNMAQEWAALPRATGPNAGRSHYDGDGLNQSLIGLDEARAIFDGQHVPDVIPRGGAGGYRAGGLPQPRRMDWFDEVTTPGGMAVNVRYRVVDLADLQRATGDLQPRDRSRAASDEQIAGIARNLDPARLLPSPESTSGAPIVGPDMMVESGNGRIAALNRAAEEHPDRFQAYVRAIEEAGFDVPDGVSRPALVAERITDLDFEGRRRFVRESNTSSIGRMSATEQAGVDADYLTQQAFDRFQAGRGLNSPENAEFVRRIFAAMPQAERAGLMTADGRLNIDGLRRLRQALFARAFDAQDLLKLLAETEHPAVENMLRMLEDLAPDWAAFRARVDAGYIRPEFDITDQLMDAVRMIVRARIEPRGGQGTLAALRDRLLQGDMFTTRDPEMVDAIMGVFFRGDLDAPVKGNRSRSPDASAAILTRYMAEAEIAGRADIEDMFAAEAGVTPTAVLREAAAAQDARAPMPSRAEPDAEAQDGAAGGQPDIRALDAMDSKDGVQSLALVRATDAELRDLAEAAEPATPRAEEADPVIEDARAALEADPDLTLRMGEGDGVQEVSVADLLADLDQDDALIRSMTSCNLKGAPA